MSDHSPSGDLLALTTEIVSAHVANNTVALGDLPQLIQEVYRTLTGLGTVPVQQERPQPAVPVKKSITPSAVICLECGKKFSMLKRHLRTDHDTSPDAYRAKWGLPSTYPIVAPEYAARRSALAVVIGLGHKRGSAVTPPVVAEKPARGRKKVTVCWSGASPD